MKKTKRNSRSALDKPFRRQTAPGAVPGSVVDSPSEPDPTITVIAYSPDAIHEQVITALDAIDPLLQDAKVTWINVDGLGDPDTIKNLGRKFHLHRLALEDTVNVHQRTKIEKYDDYLFIVSRMGQLAERVDTEQIAIFMGTNFVMTFQEGTPGDCLDPVRERLRGDIGHLRSRSSDFLVYALLDTIIDNYFPIVERYGEWIDQLDSAISAGEDQGTMSQLRYYRTDLLMLRRIVREHRELVSDMIRREESMISDDTRLFLRDCYDHTVQLAETINTYREICGELRDYNLALLSNRTNEVMRTLTIIATIFIPLSFIAGLYGMNFQHMPELHWRYGYYGVIGLMASIAGSLLLWFRRRGWL